MLRGSRELRYLGTDDISGIWGTLSFWLPRAQHIVVYLYAFAQ